MSAPVLVEARDLEMAFDVSKPWLSRVIDRSPRQIVKAVAGVSFDIPRGQTFSLVGESGCGKSTVARLVVGLYRPTAGKVTVGGQELARMSRSASKGVRQQLTMIFQDPYASLNPRWRVADIIAEPLRAFKLADGKIEQRKRVDGLLRQVGLAPADGDKFPHEFSGGQRQRISIARALASKPDFIVCDEPTSALDVSVQAQILNLMTDLQRELGLTYLFISHNLSVVAHVSDRVGVMYLGRIVEEAPKVELFTSPRHPYTKLLLDTLPDLSMEKRNREPVAGEVPNPIDPPPGCHFHPRCPLATDICRAQRPEMRVLGNARVACHHAE
ncbi:ABC transporter ATP-binding protein [Lacibacterium aquatile]|uniref:ABC transporter ATP-binding protein n=1 Tax=Lacibacterium aquatile TaxID=1168082 RepID=A0ABW5DUC2_9PROT